MGSVRPRSNPPITVYPTATLNGVAEDPDSNAQAIVLATDVTGEGDLESVSAASPLAISDASPSLEPINSFGATIPAEGGLVVDANSARQKVDVLNPNSVRIWLGLGETAAVGNGGFLDPGGCLTEYTSSAVYAIAQDGSEVTVCGQEWAA